MADAEHAVIRAVECRIDVDPWLIPVVVSQLAEPRTVDRYPRTHRREVDDQPLVEILALRHRKALRIRRRGIEVLVGGVRDIDVVERPERVARVLELKENLSDVATRQGRVRRKHASRRHVEFGIRPRGRVDLRDLELAAAVRGEGTRLVDEAEEVVAAIGVRVVDGRRSADAERIDPLKQRIGLVGEVERREVPEHVDRDRVRHDRSRVARREQRLLAAGACHEEGRALGPTSKNAQCRRVCERWIVGDLDERGSGIEPREVDVAAETVGINPVIDGDVVGERQRAFVIRGERGRRDVVGKSESRLEPLGRICTGKVPRLPPNAMRLPGCLATTSEQATKEHEKPFGETARLSSRRTGLSTQGRPKQFD